LLDAVDVTLEVNALNVEAKLEILVVEDANVALRVVPEYFDHSGRVDQVIFEEDRKRISIWKDWARVGCSKVL